MRHKQVNEYGIWAIGLHWLIALLILGLIGLGFVMRRTAIDPALQFSLYQWHKSIGLVVLGLAVLRGLIWFVARHPAPVPSLGPIERRASLATHLALALLCLVVPVAGWAIASTTPLNIPTFFFDLVVIPPLPLGRSEAGEDFWSLVHAGTAYLLLALAALHAAAALYHHFVRDDEVLLRMLGRRRAEKGPAPAACAPGGREGAEQ
ncbi:MAG TPA: cytochrome b/b6 domain-containing protein [Mycoplana sp.]|nr:cytochrome b/b6 domain-containing protein [Mycoplana sp.]